MPRTCQWPTNLDNLDDAAQATLDPDIPRCGTRTPSFHATPDPTVGPIDVCDVHKHQAEAAGWEVGPYLTTRTRARLAETRPDEAALTAVLTNHDATTPDPEQPDTADPQPHREIRQEIEVLRHIADRMAALPDDDARRRVATWVADRYGAPI